jgi:hypothetical protein
MKISGDRHHGTSLQYRRSDDMNMAKALAHLKAKLVGKRMKVAPAVAESVVVSGNLTKPADTEES